MINLGRISYLLSYRCDAWKGKGMLNMLADCLTKFVAFKRITKNYDSAYVVFTCSNGVMDPLKQVLAGLNERIEKSCSI